MSPAEFPHTVFLSQVGFPTHMLVICLCSPPSGLSGSRVKNEKMIQRCGWLSEILTRDSISLKESLDRVHFCYLAISSGKAGTIGRKQAGDTNKRARSYCSVYLLSSVETDTRGDARCTDVPRRKRGWSNSALGHCHWTPYQKQVQKHFHHQLSNDRMEEIDHRIRV